jgi:zinc protease
MVELATDNQLAGTLVNNLYLNRSLKYTSDLQSKINVLTAEQVNAAFKKYISYENISIVKAGDFAKKVKNIDTSKK